MDTKKISFGFSKTNKLPLLTNKHKPKEESKVELIKCLEGQEIKLVEEKPEEAPLVIVMKENQTTSKALASLMKRRAVLLDEPEPEGEDVTKLKKTNEVPNNGEPENLEKRAERELLAEVQKNGELENTSNLILPILKADELPLDGAKESTLDDYESIPVQHFGMAMLRGMGWVEPPPQKKGAAPIDEAPFVRPKGMGLGADKALKTKPLLIQPEANEVLAIKKQAYVRILGGKHKDLYGQIEGFDDHVGRVIVKMAVGGAKEAFNEFLCQPVSKKEFAEYGKCINTAKYEEYKKMENEHGQIVIKKETRDVKPMHIKKDKDDDKPMASRDNDDRKEYKYAKYKNEKSTISNSRERSRSRNHNEYERRNDGNRKNRDEKRKHHDEDGYQQSSTSRYNDDELQIRRREKFEGHERRRSYSRSPTRIDRQSRRDSKQLTNARRREDNRSTSETESDSDDDSETDSAYEQRRRHKKSISSNKKSSTSSTAKKSKKKHKSKSKSHRKKYTSSNNSDSSSAEVCVSSDGEQYSKKHKKKTKKSKKQRSRSCSKGRGRN